MYQHTDTFTHTLTESSHTDVDSIFTARYMNTTNALFAQYIVNRCLQCHDLLLTSPRSKFQTIRHDDQTYCDIITEQSTDGDWQNEAADDWQCLM